MSTPEMRELVNKLIGGVCNPEFLEALDASGYYEAPAGAYHHGAYPGGLFDHSINVYMRLREFTEKMGLKWQREDSPAVIAMLHDVCKIWQYDVEFVEEEHIKPNGDKTIEEVAHFSWRKGQELPGHGDASLIRIMEIGCINLTPEEIYCIRYHMGAYEGKEAWDSMDKAIRQWPNIIYVQAADMLASKVDEKEGR